MLLMGFWGKRIVLYNRPILVVENGLSAEPTVRGALEMLGVAKRIVQISTATEAMAYLQDEQMQRPAVIIADASAKGTGGLDMLRQVKADPQLSAIPVIMVALSSDIHVIDESFSLGVAGYVVKSSDSGEFTQALRSVHEYWMLSEVPVGR